jgi:hypothetical protein
VIPAQGTDQADLKQSQVQERRRIGEQLVACAKGRAPFGDKADCGLNDGPSKGEQAGEKEKIICAFHGRFLRKICA